MENSSGELFRRSGARPIGELQSSGLSRKDKLLGLSVSPAASLLGFSVSPPSVHSLSSDATDVNDLDELDEEEIWSVEARSVEGRGDAEPGKGQASLPPRVIADGRNGSIRSGISESRSSLKDGSPPWAVPVARGLSSIPGLSPEGPNGGRGPIGRILGKEGTSRRIPPASRMIPRKIPQEATSRLDDASRRMMPQSAPVNIPDWSKVQKIGRQRGTKELDVDEDQDDKEEERLPPHEFLAREYARSQMTSFSVFEGAGRTLKGRDLSRVRNAILTRTGFLE